MVASELLSSFLLGLATPVTAVCVLPLYPGFLSYLSKQFDEDPGRKTYALFGTLVVTGVFTFMIAIGVIFTTLLQSSLTGVIEVVSPVAFILLGLFSLVLLADLDFSRYLPQGQTPEFENPLLNAFSFGFFFGAIVIPCNPAFISAFFARALLFDSPINSLANFTIFGLGIGFPLLVFSLVSSQWSNQVINILKTHGTAIHRISGLIMLWISLYYLSCVFGIIPGGAGEIICSVNRLIIDFFQNILTEAGNSLNGI